MSSNDVRIGREDDGIATVTLSRGKVNALNGEVVDALRESLRILEADRGARAVILTGSGKFFSFGFDIPEFLGWPREEFAEYLRRFTDLCLAIFSSPLPVVAALNGHAIAGGCMLAVACDHRVMAEGRAKIGLNEIAFGSSLFAGSVEMLRFWLGGAVATSVCYSGAMFDAAQARALGLVHETAPEDRVMERARIAAGNLAEKSSAAFAGIKRLLRQSAAEEIRRREAESIERFVEIWYSPAVRENLAKITISRE